MPIKKRLLPSALIVVDLQHDFLPGGALAVPDGDSIVEPIAIVAKSRSFGVVVATQDWHPADHISFASRHDGQSPFDTTTVNGHPQTLWPDHCVQGTEGAELHPDLPQQTVDAIIRKGTDPTCDSYSGFRNNWNEDQVRRPTGLAGFLNERGVTDVFICGLARDVCCKWTAEDAVESGFRTKFLWDLTRPVDSSSDDRVRSDLESAGVEILDAVLLSIP